MGDVLVIVKVYPEGPEDVEAVEKAVHAVTAGKLRDVRREPVAFGLELIKAGFTIPDKTEGALDNLEKALRGIKGVKDIEIESTTLV
jgi:translation elongation factor aEF-1 beta